MSQVTVPAPDTVHLTAPVTENSVAQDTEKAVADAREISDELSETITALELELVSRGSDSLYNRRVG